MTEHVYLVKTSLIRMRTIEIAFLTFATKLKSWWKTVPAIGVPITRELMRQADFADQILVII